MKDLPLSNSWGGTLSNNPSRQRDTQYRVPEGFNGLVLDVRAQLRPLDAIVAVDPLALVAVGYIGGNVTIDTSTVGAAWTPQASPGAGLFYWAVRRPTDGLYVAVGPSGLVGRSADGITWVTQTVGAVTLTRVTWNNPLSLFVAVGLVGVIYTSPDGVVWTAQVSGTTDGLMGVTQNSAGLLVASAMSGGKVYTSPDAVTWTSRTTGVVVNFNATCWSPVLALFFVVGSAGTILTSPDGIAWTAQTSGLATEIVGVTDGTFGVVAVTNESPSNKVLRSTNGTAWTIFSPTFGGQFRTMNGAFWDGAKYLVFGQNSVGTGGFVAYSPTGATWTVATGIQNTFVASVAGLAKAPLSSTTTGAVAVGDLVMLSSGNGIDWASRTPPGLPPTANFYAVTYGLSAYWAVGNGGILAFSPDGRNWGTATVGIPVGRLLGITYNGSLFVAVGSAGAILTSPDGFNWTSRTSGIATELKAVCWASNISLFVTVGVSGRILSSPDGINWTSRTSGTAQTLNAIFYTPTLFSVAGNNGLLASSPDGISWSTGTIGTVSFFGLARNGLTFVAVGAGGRIQTSIDGGANFFIATSNTVQSLNAIFWNGKEFIVAANAGVTLSSPDGILWEVHFTPAVTVGNNLFALATYTTPVSRKPYINFLRHTRQGFERSTSLFLVTSPGGDEGTPTLAAQLDKEQVDAAYRFGWLAKSGDVFEMVLDYQYNNFQGEVEFMVDFIYGPVE